MHPRRENHYHRDQYQMDTEIGIRPTPSNIEWSCRRETAGYDFQDILVVRLGSKRDKERLQCSGPDAEENQDIDDEKLVISCHDPIV